ncbi:MULTISPECIES: glycine betaine/L-proline ABC transporter permease ProW [Vibrio]|uniref:Glycine/betaine ABC transporter permease n=2 Tax=Vibrio TaxID=662 RepID=A0A0Q2MGP2_VIBFU|nr:glycine betaine/L-proline ABC transporter permease ProW [Vibrio furnissii]EEX39928.1 L-proline Glycine Betaine ABC transport system permease protein proW [Vibrio furnissii CIP 102972]KQH86890.1 glycine/betaine ABC transporter permease [Vibrio furnissii]MCG6234131.1 glycine betaine/L-proline ABC transporter permease ProW [Vibrio furnissii]MCG6259664.1 glycine betaine/L-proline ABC transporter permease ProW [Vibrio furnissii]MCG6266026.1 glycine betaine/L-proline ABC transporter permease ProW
MTTETTVSAAQAADPWGAATQAATTTDPWSTGTSAAASSDWLTAAAPADTPFDWMHPFQDAILPFDSWVETALNWLVTHGRPLFQAIRVPIDFILSSFQTALVSTPAPIMLLILFLIAWQLAGSRMGIASFLSLMVIGLIGAWDQAMVTLALVMTSVFFCLLIGMPLGIWLARSDTAAKIVRPILDAMQTTPAFVYLVPIVMLFGIGNVPGVVVTIIFALPPIVRLTILGIQQVPEELIEAGHAFGASPKQMLYRIQLPLAMPTIMAGVNQTLMLSLSMVVIASMIAVGGLGQMVLRGIGRLDMGLAAVGGLGIVILAILLDRITQTIGANSRDKKTHWYEKGPASLAYQLKLKFTHTEGQKKLGEQK